LKLTLNFNAEHHCFRQIRINAAFFLLGTTNERAAAGSLVQRNFKTVAVDADASHLAAGAPAIGPAA
jgi:hypothetical protein